MPEINKENMSCYRKWFYGKISKQHVEKILSSFPNSAGCLLVRESESQPGVLVICTREETGNISYAADYENKFTDEASMPSALNQISGHLLAENKKNTIPGQTLVSVVERVVDSNNPSIAAETSDRHVLINSGENDGDERFIITPKFDIIRTTQSNLKDYTSNENSNEVVLRNRIVEKRLSSTNSLVRHSRGSGDRQSRQSDADSADNALPLLQERAIVHDYFGKTEYNNGWINAINGTRVTIKKRDSLTELCLVEDEKGNTGKIPKTCLKLLD